LNQRVKRRSHLEDPMTDERAPVELRNATVQRLFGAPEFGVAKRGYDPSEVAGFLDRLGSRMVTLLERLGTAEKSAKTARAELDDFKIRAEQAESSRGLFQRTLLLAEETATASVSDAKIRAERIESEAQTAAHRMIGETRLRIERMMDGARLDVQKTYIDEREAIVEERRRLEGESDQLETLRLAVAAESMALEEVRNELRRRIRLAATDLLGVAESPDCLGRPVTRGIPEVVAHQMGRRLAQEAAVPDAGPDTAESVTPALATVVQPAPNPSVTSSPTPLVEPEGDPSIDLSGREGTESDPAPEHEPAKSGADAFDRFMSDEIDEEPSRSWILA
jgi:DivIVA domain-containing protein